MKRVTIGVLAVLAGAAVGLADEGESALPSRVTPVVLAAQKAGPAVVNITTERIVMRRSGVSGLPFDDLFNWGPATPQRTRGVGSGALVADTGYIVTNAHVVQDAVAISVLLADEKRLPARLISSDAASDLAVIKIEAPVLLPFIEMYTSADLMPGETVIALGNPFGYGHTVTAGVVSAVKRDLVAEGQTVYTGLIQTDAAINPGSSGGPLVNVHGKLVGINTAIRADAQNIGFAIPVDRVRASLIELLDFRAINHTWLGLEVAEVRVAGAPDRHTVVVKAVEPDGPAAQGGLAAGDDVQAIDGRPIRNLIDFKARILEKRVGDVVQVVVLRAGQRRNLSVRLAEAPRKPARELIRERLGLDVQDLTVEVAEQMRLAVKRGLLVAGVVRNGPADDAGIRSGDVVVQVGTFRLERVEELATALERLPKGGQVRLAIVRGRYIVWLRLQAR